MKELLKGIDAEDQQMARELIRLVIATAAMCAIRHSTMAALAATGVAALQPDEIAKASVIQADALLKELEA